jgi:hypothetical protein
MTVLGVVSVCSARGFNRTVIGPGKGDLIKYDRDRTGNISGKSQRVQKTLYEKRGKKISGYS